MVAGRGLGFRFALAVLYNLPYHRIIAPADYTMVAVPAERANGATSEVTSGGLPGRSFL